MSLSEEDVRALSEFGLTTVQARIYLASVKLRLASASQIAKLSKVRREDVYRSLPRLESLGLVERTIGFPVKIRSTPVEQALSLLIKSEEGEAKQKFQTLKAKKAKIIQHLKSAAQTPITQEEQLDFSLLSSIETISGKTSNIIKNTKLELDLVFGKKRLAWALFEFAEELKRLTLAGARLRMISDLKDCSETFQEIVGEQLQPNASIEIRYVDVPLDHFLISDFKEGLLFTSTEGSVAECSCLWTSNSCMIDILHKNFEALWHTGIAPQDFPTIPIAPTIYEKVKELKPTDHAIFVYNSIEEKHQTLFSFLNAGLINNEAAIYITSEETPMEIKTAMQKYGIDVKKHKKTGALKILNYTDVYIINGKFSVETATGFGKREYYRAQGKFKGLRVTGEMSWFFKNGLETNLLNYEMILHRILDIPIIAVCAYNSKDLQKSKDSINLYASLIAAHEQHFTGLNSVR